MPGRDGRVLPSVAGAARPAGADRSGVVATGRGPGPDPRDAEVAAARSAPDPDAGDGGFDPLESPTLLERLRIDPGRRGVRALAAVVAVVAVGAAGVAFWNRPEPTPVAPVRAANPSPTVATSLVVAVTGKVRRPGLVRVVAGSRVADVVEAAGGALPDVDLGGLNLARKVTDGELIVVGAPAPAPGPAGVPGAPAGKVNLNTASPAELDVLPGVGPVTAQRIIEYRTAHGPFADVSGLKHVEGIGDARFEQLKDLVTV
ncbi:ComEA family DNA-binding protein [Longispora sp. K20-0274]|uniref:helix-hairpin-helix domain-containing protein n=1 Tax=Longispora sp. K20-0274 TaxID=3088255 RepID=UPI00399B71F1